MDQEAADALVTSGSGFRERRRCRGRGGIREGQQGLASRTPAGPSSRWSWPRGRKVSVPTGRASGALDGVARKVGLPDRYEVLAVILSDIRDGHWAGAAGTGSHWHRSPLPSATARRCS